MSRSGTGSGGGARHSSSMPAESETRNNNLGLESMLPLPPSQPQRPPLPPSGRGSSSSSVSAGNKRKASESSMNVPIGQSSSSAQAAENKDANELVVAGTSNAGTRVVASVDIASLDDDDEDMQEEMTGTGKRQKRRTSIVWKYFTKETVEVEVNGKKYEQLWAYCNFPKCKQRYRAESNHGTNAFRNHLRSHHSIVKGQLELKAEKDHGKDVTTIQPFRY